MKKWNPAHIALHPQAHIALRPLPFSLLLTLLVLSASAANAGTWGAETNLSATTTDSETGLNHRPLLYDSNGALHVVWAEKDAPNQNYRIYSRTSSGATWSAPQLAVDYLAGGQGTNGGAKYPSLAIEPSGVLHLFWHDYRIASINNIEIYTKTRAPGLTWNPSHSADIRLTTTNHPETGGDNGYVPTTAFVGGTIHVLWYDFRFDGSQADIFCKTRPAGGDWNLTPGDSADVRVASDGDHSELAAVAADASGHLHAAWRSAGAGAHVFYSRRDASTGAWSPTFDVDVAGSAAGAPAIAIDGAGTAHVVWPDSRDGGRALFTRTRSASGTWSTISRITRPGDAADEPSMTFEDGTIHLVWHDARISLFNREVFHREKSTGSPWDTTGASDQQISNASGNSTRPSVAASGGRLAILWKDARTGNNDVFVRVRTEPATSAALAHSISSPIRVFPNPVREGFARITRGSGAPLGEIVLTDVRGAVVRTLRTSASSLHWDARDDRGRPLPAGVYYARAGEGAPASIVVVR
jgi:hypothetical protein